LPSAANASHADVLDEFVLQFDEKNSAYFGHITLDPARLGPADRNVILSLAVEEYEVYPAAEGALDATGDSLVMIGGRKCGRQLVFSYTFDI
jgi:hypothetical protein